MKKLLAAVLASCLVLGALACADDPPTAPDDRATPSDVALFGKPAPGPHTYEIVRTGGPWTWTEAKRAASRLPAKDRARPHLATFTDEAEQAAALGTPAAEGWCWIGLYQNKRATTPSEMWSWLTREDLVWTDWNTYPLEPNDGDGLENGAQNVAFLRFGAGATYSYWVDHEDTSPLDCMIVEWE